MPLFGFASKSSGRSHLRCPDLVAGLAGEDGYLFGTHAVDQRFALAVFAGAQDGYPLAGSVELAVRRKFAAAVDLAGGVSAELCDVQCSGVEQSHVVAHGCLTLAVLHLSAGDELVHVVEALVVAAVGDDGAVRRDVNGGGFVLETSERCVLDRSRRRIPGIDLDDVSESVDLVGFCDQIEPLVEAFPLALGSGTGKTVALQSRCDRGIGDTLGVREVLVEVLFAGKHCAPGCDAASAIVEGAEHFGSRGIGTRLEEVAACSGAGHDKFRGSGDAAIVRSDLRYELAVVGFALDLDDRQSVAGQADLELLLGRVLRIVAAEHRRLGGVFVIDHE